METESEVKDYPPEQDAEEVVLSRWDKIKQWIEIAMATKKLYLLVMSFFAITGGSAVVGLVTNTNPLRDAAIEVGLVDDVLTIKEDSVDNHLHEEITKLISELRKVQEEVHILETRPSRAGTAGLEGPPGKNGIDGKPGKDGKNGRDGKDGIGAGLSAAEIDTAFEEHIAGDH